MNKTDSTVRAASDVGGTFTDLVYFDANAAGGVVSVVKTDTTPPDFERGVLESLKKSGVDPATLVFFAHGSTVVINALTERKGAKTALITTKGFRDVLEIARGNRPDLFNFNFRKPKPFVERYLRLELNERVDYHGTLERRVDCSTLPEQLEYFKSEGVEAIAIAFLHAYTNPSNELEVVEEIQRLWPGVSTIASHQVSREWREYERTNTTVLAAYVHPIANAYIERLESGLEQGGMSGSPYMMQSNGGITTAAAAKRNPIAMVESGPASGIFASAYLGKAINEENLIVLDIGGTTAKCALIDEGQVKVTTEYHIERTSKNPGFPIQTPVSEIVEIGNGGGSIAWTDAGNKLHVGPQSAGANPGPAAYGRGGTKPTTTDANLVLGRIDPSSFVGGEVDPDWDAVDAAFAPLQDALSMNKEDIARGIVQIANANMANALRLVSTNKGYDPRDFALIAFGGGGAMHAVALAEQLKVQKVIVPVNSSVFSAWGMLLTDLRRDYIQTRPMGVNSNNHELLISTFESMKEEAVRDYSDDGIDDATDMIEFTTFADMRYEGQEHTVKVPLDLGDAASADELDEAIDRFHSAHEKRFTYRLENAIQIVNFHIVASVPVEKPELAVRELSDATAEAAVLGKREVDFHPHGVHEATIYDGTRLPRDAKVHGPAVIQEPSVTLPLFPGNVATLDNYGNYHVDFGAEETA
ncbi:MAG: hydantoinase/oxoprolinase family protein [Candidatus Azotimanducaceae bacterium WSBS_2022_MAG_OTU7]